MKFRLEILIPVLYLGYIAFFPLNSGEITHYFIKSYILLPFILLNIALITLSFGSQQLLEIFSAARVFFIKSKIHTNLQAKTLQGAIGYSYVSALLWVLYALVIMPSMLNTLNSQLMADIALALTYAFIVAELFLRPLQRRLDFLTL